MNRYSIIGARLDMAAGLHVLVVMPTHFLARDAFEQVEAELVDGEADRVVRASGREEISTSSGGRITFFGINDRRLRGRCADVVIADRDLLDEHAVVLAGCVRGSRLDDEHLLIA